MQIMQYLQFCVSNKIVNDRAIYILSKSLEFIFFSSIRVYLFWTNLSADIFDSSMNCNSIVSCFNGISSNILSMNLHNAVPRSISSRYRWFIYLSSPIEWRWQSLICRSQRQLVKYIQLPCSPWYHCSARKIQVSSFHILSAIREKERERKSIISH